MEGSVHPLNKLKVVLEFGFHQFLDLSESQSLYLNELLDMEELETCLQDFEIVQEVHLQLGIPFDFVQWHSLGICCIQKVTVDAARPKLLNFGDMDQQSVVDPADDVETRGVAVINAGHVGR